MVGYSLDLQTLKIRRVLSHLGQDPGLGMEEPDPGREKDTPGIP